MVSVFIHILCTLRASRLTPAARRPSNFIKSAASPDSSDDSETTSLHPTSMGNNSQLAELDVLLEELRILIKALPSTVPDALPDGRIGQYCIGPEEDDD